MSANAEKPTRTSLTREDGFRFRVRFDRDGVPDLLTDEPPPLGRGAGPDPSRLLAAAVSNCLAASLLFCMQRARLDPRELEAKVDTAIGRNAEGREIFESFCTVTESVRHGIDGAAAVEPEVVRG